MAQHNILGRIGEDLAALYLKRLGYKIKERNWKFGDLETDIIAVKDGVIAFIEVKTRTAGGAKNPEDAVDEERKHRLTAGAQAYIRFNKIDLPWRFDIIAITMHLLGPELNHIEDAFSPRMRTINSNSFNGQNRWKPKKKKRISK